MKADLLSSRLAIICDAFFRDDGAHCRRSLGSCSIDIVFDCSGDLRAASLQPVALAPDGLTSGEGQELRESLDGRQVHGVHIRGALVELRQL
jgi:hypothetical protein